MEFIHLLIKKLNIQIFDESEMGFYKNINDLGKKIEILLSNPKKLQKFGRLGKKRYFELFNNKKIAKEIIDFTF